jgi:glutathione S-transferase
LPDVPEAAARVQRWLSIAAGEVRYGPAIAGTGISTRWAI